MQRLAILLFSVLVPKLAAAKPVDTSGLVGDFSLAIGASDHYGLTSAGSAAVGWRVSQPLEVSLATRFLWNGLGDHGAAGPALIGNLRLYLSDHISLEAGGGRAFLGGWPAAGEWGPVDDPWLATGGAGYALVRSGRTAIDLRATVSYLSSLPADRTHDPFAGDSGEAVSALIGVGLRLY